MFDKFKEYLFHNSDKKIRPLEVGWSYKCFVDLHQEGPYFF